MGFYALGWVFIYSNDWEYVVLILRGQDHRYKGTSLSECPEFLTKRCSIIQFLYPLNWSHKILLLFFKVNSTDDIKWKRITNHLHRWFEHWSKIDIASTKLVRFKLQAQPKESRWLVKYPSQIPLCSALSRLYLVEWIPLYRTWVIFKQGIHRGSVSHSRSDTRNDLRSEKKLEKLRLFKNQKNMALHDRPPVEEKKDLVLGF